MGNDEKEAVLGKTEGVRYRTCYTVIWRKHRQNIPVMTGRLKLYITFRLSHV